MVELCRFSEKIFSNITEYSIFQVAAKSEYSGFGGRFSASGRDTCHVISVAVAQV